MSYPIVDISNKRFGSLLVLPIDNVYRKNGITYWKCLCDCGNTKFINGRSLRTNKTTSEKNNQTRG